MDAQPGQSQVRSRAGQSRVHTRSAGRRRRLLLSAAAAAALALVSAAVAIAAGSGYAGPPPPTGVPLTGFSAIVTAKTASPKGGIVAGNVAGGRLLIRVPKSASKKAFQVAIAKGLTRTVKRDLPPTLKHDAVLAGFRIELRRGSSTVRTSKPVTLLFNDRRIGKGDIVAIYRVKTGRFAVMRAKVQNGRLPWRLKVGETIAVLAPQRGHRRPAGNPRPRKKKRR